MDAAGRPRGSGRSPGLHLSDIIDRKAKALDAPRGTPPGEQPFVRMMSGFVLERAMERAFAEYMALSLATFGEEPIELGASRLYLRKDVRTQFEIIHHGYAMTLDGHNPYYGCTESFKMTWRSQSGFEGKEFGSATIDLMTPEAIESRAQDYWRWEMQEKEYCYNLGLKTALYFILWANGDYKRGLPGHGPQVVPYLVEYEDEELQANHEDVIWWRDKMVNEEGWQYAVAA